MKEGGQVRCPNVSGTDIYCPRTALGVTMDKGEVVRGDYVATTTIPGSTPETVTQEYVTGPYFF